MDEDLVIELNDAFAKWMCACANGYDRSRLRIAANAVEGNGMTDLAKRLRDWDDSLYKALFPNGE
jgi:hypothetical protein